MAMQYLEREFKKRGDKDLATIVRGLRDTYKKRHPGEVDLALPVSAAVRERLPQAQKPSVPELDLQAEWIEQSQKYIDWGYHKELSMSQEDYLASLPKFEPQPEAFVGRFDIPILVETRIVPKRQAELAGLNYLLRGLNVHDWEDDPKKYKTPKIPYTTWMQDGKKNLKRSVRNVRRTLEADERGATEYDGIARWIANPSVLEDHYIDLPGTSVESGGRAPYLCQWRGRPGVDGSHVDSVDPGCGSASCGRVEI